VLNKIIRAGSALARLWSIAVAGIAPDMGSSNFLEYADSVARSVA
jgi:hypothetical protein